MAEPGGGRGPELPFRCEPVFLQQPKASEIVGRTGQRYLDPHLRQAWQPERLHPALTFNTPKTGSISPSWIGRPIGPLSFFASVGVQGVARSSLCGRGAPFSSRGKFESDI
jgi:hypothetical protein